VTFQRLTLRSALQLPLPQLSLISTPTAAGHTSLKTDRHAGNHLPLRRGGAGQQALPAPPAQHQEASASSRKGEGRHRAAGVWLAEAARARAGGRSSGTPLPPRGPEAGPTHCIPLQTQEPQASSSSTNQAAESGESEIYLGFEKTDTAPRAGRVGRVVKDDPRKYPGREDVGWFLGAVGGWAGGEAALVKLKEEAEVRGRDARQLLGRALHEPRARRALPLRRRGRERCARSHRRDHGGRGELQ
jgi:hypothetical protein